MPALLERGHEVIPMQPASGGMDSDVVSDRRWAFGCGRTDQPRCQYTQHLDDRGGLHVVPTGAGAPPRRTCGANTTRPAKPAGTGLRPAPAAHRALASSAAALWVDTGRRRRLDMHRPAEWGLAAPPVPSPMRTPWRSAGRPRTPPTEPGHRRSRSRLTLSRRTHDARRSAARPAHPAYSTGPPGATPRSTGPPCATRGVAQRRPRLALVLPFSHVGHHGAAQRVVDRDHVGV